MDKEFISEKIEDLLNKLGLSLVNSTHDFESITDVYEDDKGKVVYITLEK